MQWLHLVSYFLGGVFIANAVPHFVAGTMGHAFQSPFAKPPGEGQSSSTVNAVWGCVNLAVAYALIFQVGAFDPRALPDILPLAAGGALKAILGAYRFGKFNAGRLVPNIPRQSDGDATGGTAGGRTA